MTGHREILSLHLDGALMVIESGTESCAGFTNVGDFGTFRAHDTVQHIACVAGMIRWADSVRWGYLDNWISNQMSADLAAGFATHLIAFRGRRFG